MQTWARQLEWEGGGSHPSRRLEMPVLSDAPRVREGAEAEVSRFVGVMPPDDDRGILQAIKAGDARALGRLYRRYGPSVVALCRRILGDPTEAEDAALDSFVQVWEQSDRYDPSRASPLTYLMTIARSRAIDRLRARRRRPVPVDWNDEAWPERESSHAGPYDAAVEAERRDRVQAALRALSERERRPIELSFYAGLSHREIAERLVLPLGTVKTRIRQGLIRLRGLFQNDGRPL